MNLIRMIFFYKNKKKRLFELVGKKDGELLLKAVRRDMPIMISERNAKTNIDGELYNILKGLGAKSVKSASIELENIGILEGTYITYFNEVNANLISNV